MIYEIQMTDKFYYIRARNEKAACEKCKKAFGRHLSNPFATGRTKTKGPTDA